MNLTKLWLESNKLTTKEKEEIRKLSIDEQNQYFSNIPLSFGTAGVRAKMGMGTQKMNRFTYTALAYAYGKHIANTYGKNKTVVVGHDNRLNSDAFSLLVADVLTSFGVKVLLFKNNNLMPTPIISYAIRQTKSVGGIIITASHNPKEYNGFKAYHNDGGQVLPDEANKILSYLPKTEDLLNVEYKKNSKLISYISNDLITKYFKDAQQAIVNKKIINKKKSYPVVFTGHHGTSSKLLPQFLKTLNFNVKPVVQQTFYDPNFVNSPISNPEQFESFDLSIKLAEKVKSNICIGIDPDADRMAVCLKHNGQWKLMTGNDMGIIYTYYVLKHKKFNKTPYLVSSYVSTNLIDRIAKPYKAKVYRTGTGFKWMGAKVTEIGNKEAFVVAFEEAIGALNSTIDRDKDSFTASALALEIYDVYKQKNMDFIDILEKEIYPKYGYWFGKTVSYTFNDLDWKPVVLKKMDMFKTYKAKTFGSFKIKQIKWNKVGDCLDWLSDNDQWIRFRMSGTEPKFKIYYNLYGNDLNSLDNQFNELNKIFKQKLGV